jgi:AmiR/NasT family two-component response regulator
MIERRVVIANEEPKRLEALAEVVAVLGYEPVLWGAAPDEATSGDVALVGRNGQDELAFSLIASITHERSCPVVAALPEPDPGYVREAARAGAFGYFVGLDADDLASAVEIALDRFSEYHGLQDAFARRAVVEQAKGILMAVHGVDQSGAFDLLRAHARSHSRKLVDVADAVVESHPLLVPSWARPSQREALDS